LWSRAVFGRTWLPGDRLWHAADGGGVEDAAMEVEAIARLVYDRLGTMRAGRVLAVWADGTITEEGFGFPGQRRSGDGWESAVTSFPAGTQMSYYDMLQRLL